MELAAGLACQYGVKLVRVIFDIEANGLLDTATVMHCLVAKDIDSGVLYKFYPGCHMTWEREARSFLDRCTTLIAHNGITFDIPFLKKIYGWVPKESVEIIDTLVMSRHLNPDRSRVEGVSAGPHAVESWGMRLGRWKPEINDWSVFTPEMLHRCVEDVEIQHLIYKELLSECTITNHSYSIFDSYAYEQHDWSQSMYIEHRSAQIMHEQEQNGCGLNKDDARKFVCILDDYIEDLEKDIKKLIPSSPKQHGVSVNRPFKNNGELTKMVSDWLFPHEWYQVCGPFSRIDWIDINLNSDIQVKKWLYTLGWEPTEWNYSKKEFGEDGKPLRTSPKLTEESFDSLPEGIGSELKRRSKGAHRRSQIQGWIGHIRPDGRITAGANPQGTNTGRMRHRLVANIPKATVYENKDDKSDPSNGTLVWYPEKQKVFFGTEMRSLFCSIPPMVLCGRDASGLELRCFAHYINDPVYTDIILHGDIHTYNMEMAGLDDREQAKTFIYAFLYGAGDAKIGEIVLPLGTEAQRKRIGAELKARFLLSNPNLEGLIKGVKKASRRGWLKGLDNRKLWMRHNQRGGIAENKALNTLLQGAGAIIMTYARVWLYDEVQKIGGNDFATKVLDYHDEETYEVLPENTGRLKELMVESVVQAGIHLKLNCPLNAGAKVGKSWAYVH